MNILKYNTCYSHVSSHLLFECSNNKEVLVSIVIPTYKRLGLLLQAINSVIDQNNKNVVNYEIIIVDNDPDNISNVELQRLVANFNHTNLRYYVNSENIGMMGNWNRGIELAYGKWIIQLHDDDYFLPNFIETVFNDINRFREADAIIHSTLIYDKRKDAAVNLDIKDKRVYYTLNSLHVINGNYHISGALIRKDVVCELGGFNPQMYPISDYDFNERLIQKYSAILISNYPLAVIIFEENETLNPKIFSNWFTLERIIKNNAVAHRNRVLRYVLSKVINVQVNVEIDYYIKEILLEEEARNFVKEKYLIVRNSDVLMWKFYKTYLRLLNLVIRKKY